MKKIKLLENADYTAVYGLITHLEQRYNCSNFEVTKNAAKASLEVTLTGDEKVYGCTPKNIKTIVKNYIN